MSHFPIKQPVIAINTVGVVKLDLLYQQPVEVICSSSSNLQDHYYSKNGKIIRVSEIRFKTRLHLFNRVKGPWIMPQGPIHYSVQSHCRKKKIFQRHSILEKQLQLFCYKFMFICFSRKEFFRGLETAGLLKGLPQCSDMAAIFQTLHRADIATSFFPVSTPLN